MGNRLRKESRTRSDGVTVTTIETRAEDMMVGACRHGDGKGLDKASGIDGEAGKECAVSSHLASRVYLCRQRELR